MTAILTDLAGESEEPETDMPVTAQHKDAIMVRRKFWNVVKGMETDENVMIYDYDMKLRYLTTVFYEWNEYYVFVTEDNRDSNSREIIILIESGYETADGTELQPIWETVDNVETRYAVFNIFMNEKDGKETYEIIE